MILFTQLISAPPCKFILVWLFYPSYVNFRNLRAWAKFLFADRKRIRLHSRLETEGGLLISARVRSQIACIHYRMLINCWLHYKVIEPHEWLLGVPVCK